MSRKLLAATLSALLSGASCYSYSHESSRTSPSTTAAQALGGVWATAQSLPGTGAGGTVQSCTNFSWRVTDFAGNSGSGTFTATCMGVLKITGSAQGLVSGTSLNWSAAGTATGSGCRPCAASRWPARRISPTVRFVFRTAARAVSEPWREQRYLGNLALSWKLEATSNLTRITQAHRRSSPHRTCTRARPASTRC